MELPSYVLEVIYTLKNHGHQAMMVGGCVRDILAGHEPADYDVATSAATDEIKALFPQRVPIGEKHGTIVVLIGGGTVEVSTFKGENFKQDLLLRDFTINAMAMEESGFIVDPYGGKEDLSRKLLRCPGNQVGERFREDPLRMMRAVRLCVVFGYVLHPDVTEEIQRRAGEIAGVAVERIRAELNNILMSERPGQGIRLLQKTGLLAQIAPELSDMVGFDQRNIRHDKDVFEHTLAVVEAVPGRLNVRLAALLHDSGKPRTFTLGEDGVGHFYGHHLEGLVISKDILQRLKYDNQTINDVSVLVAEHMSRFPKVRNSSLKKLINRVGIHNLEDLFALQKADILGSAPPFDLLELEAMQEGVEQILKAQPPMTVKDLAINGGDLLALGVRSGPSMGKMLNDLLETVLDEPDKNQRETLLSLVREKIDHDVIMNVDR